MIKPRQLFLWGIVFVLGLAIASSAYAQRPKGKKGQGRRPGEKNTPPARKERVTTTLKQGDKAPDFSLPKLKGKDEIRLSQYRGKKPVVLIFASYT